MKAMKAMKAGGIADQGRMLHRASSSCMFSLFTHASLMARCDAWREPWSFLVLGKMSLQLQFQSSLASAT